MRGSPGMVHTVTGEWWTGSAVRHARRDAGRQLLAPQGRATIAGGRSLEDQRRHRNVRSRPLPAPPGHAELRRGPLVAGQAIPLPARPAHRCPTGLRGHTRFPGPTDLRGQTSFRSHTRLHRRSGCRGHAAFTLVELLIVIAVIGILIGLVGLVGSRLAEHNKVRFTQVIMRNTKLAIDAFSDANPLASIYDRPNGRTFGTLPPYQLANYVDGTVSAVLEPPGSLPGSYALANRFHRDFGGPARPGNVSDWVSWGTGQPKAEEHNDNRALFVYLKAFVPDALAQIPPAALKPLTGDIERVNPQGSGPQPPNPNTSWFDILGIHDAWGVPLDYLVYVKFEWGMSPTGLGTWQATDRVGALRSRGISAEVYEAAKKDGSLGEHPGFFSDPLAAPHLRLTDPNSPRMPTGGTQNSGWARVRAGWNGGQEDYSYVP